MKRRSLLSAAASLPLMTGHVALHAAPAAQSRFLLVFLRGGYDAAHLLVPHGSDLYYQWRPNIAIPRPSEDKASAVALDAMWGLHPAVRDTLAPMLARRELCFVPFAGTEDLSRSHFETQDAIELGQPLGARRNYRSGFMARLADVLSGAPISFTDQLPLTFAGNAAVPNLSLRSLSKPTVDARRSRVIASMYAATPWAAQVEEGFAVRQDITAQMQLEMEAASRDAVTAKGFELEARRIARAMRDHYNLGFVDVGGWDTHVGQGAAAGYLASRFDELSRGLAAYAGEIGPAWRDTTVVVLSEFGRTFRENGSRGTDHGHGSVMWVLGGAGKPAIAGEQVALTPGSLLQNRDWPVLNDYRAVLGGIFAQQFGLSPGQLQQVFPGAPAVRLGLA